LEELQKGKLSLTILSPENKNCQHSGRKGGKGTSLLINTKLPKCPQLDKKYFEPVKIMTPGLITPKPTLRSELIGTASTELLRLTLKKMEFQLPLFH